MFKGYKDLPCVPMTWDTTMVNMTGGWRTYKPILDEEKCNKCYICWKFCPEAAIEVDEELEEVPKIDYDHCKGCAICANECPKEAIIMIEESLEE
jgi:2-oxoisovalerate ferredoxin oxidoreductase delta subunit